MLGLTPRPIWAIWCDGNTSRVRVEWGWGHPGAQKTCNISEKCKIGPRLLWQTNKKSHTRFRLVPTTNINDLGWTWTTETFCPSVTFRYRDHVGWNTSKISSRLISLRFMLRLIPIWAIWFNGNTQKLGWNRGGVMSAKTCNISETVQDYYTAIRSLSSAFQWSQNASPWMTSLINAIKGVDKIAVFSVHKRSVIDLL